MTDEFKQTLLDYLTGKLPNSGGTEGIVIKDKNEINFDLENTIRQYYDDFDSYNLNYILTRGDYLLLFINTYKTENFISKWLSSFIIVLNKNYEFIKLIDSYDSGSKFMIFLVTNSNDSGEGNIYIIENELDSNTNSIIRRRISIINDFTLTDFRVRLLASFNIPKYDNHIVTINELFKSNDSSKYFMLYSYSEGASSTGENIDFGGALEFINNVGTENEWNWYPYNGSKNINWYGYQTGMPNWNNDGLEFKIICDYASQNYNNNSIKFLILTNGENECVEDNELSLPNTVSNIGQMIGNVVINNIFYADCVSTASWLQTTRAVLKYNLDTSECETLYYKDDYYEREENGYRYYDSDNIKIFSLNNIFYFFRNYTQARTNLNNYSVEYESSILYLNYYLNNLDYLKEEMIKDITTLTNYNYDLNTYFVYNLYSIGCLFSNFVLKINHTYNQNYYNGYPYINTNALIPNSAELYSDSELIFARNLYNKTINNNVTVSTVEIPNTYLNNVNITNKNLLSQTNLHLVKDNNLLQKNIYETVFLNFINVVQVLNKDTETINRQAGVYLNAKINDEKGYDNAKITKVRIRNMEGTETVQSVQIDYPNETVSSTNPQLTNSANAELNSIKIDGKTVQDGTPTPDNPVEIKNVKGYSNLFNNGGSDTLSEKLVEKSTNMFKYIPFGNNCLKINSNGKNLFNYKDTKKVDEGIKVDEEGWITVTYDNSQSSSVKYFNYITNNLDLTEKTKYQIVTEVKKVDGELILYSVSNNQGQMKNNISYEFNGLQTNLIYRDINETYDNFNNSFYALRTYVRFAQGKKGSITFRLSVLKDISTTNEFAYTPYNTNSIFLNLKDNELAQNDFVKIANNYGTIYKTKETLELTGDEPSWLENFATKGLFQITLDNINADLTKVHAISTHFIGNKGSDIAKPTDYVDNSICTYSGNRIFFRANSYANNLNGFKQFIKDQKANGTPVVIQYDLLKPYTIDLGMQDSIYSYEGTTNISVDDELTPNIEVNYRLEGNYCILTVDIKVKEPLYQLEFISNDETNVYHTVDLSNLEVGKYYVIKQKLEVL